MGGLGHCYTHMKFFEVLAVCVFEVAAACSDPSVIDPTEISDKGPTPRPAHAAIPELRLQRHLLPTCMVKQGETSKHWTNGSMDR